MPSFIDSHCHLDADYGERTVEDLLRDAGLAGVEAVLTPATNLASSARVAALSERFSQVFHAVGVHPHDAKDFRDDQLPAFRSAAAHSKCRAIGEIGLDYHYDLSPRQAQLSTLDRQLELALELRLPVIIHSREAEGDLLPRLTDYARQAAPERPPGVIHCFSGSRSFGEACLALGFMISFSGIVTFKNAAEIRQCAALFPLDRLLIETDAPYLAPLPFRGRRCEPAMVVHTAAKVAALRGITLNALADATTANARRLFNLDS